MLHLLVLAPFAAAAIAALVSTDGRSAARWGMVASGLVLVLGFFALGFGANNQATTPLPWFPLWGGDGVVHWALASDALSTWMVHLTTVITFLVCCAAASWQQDRLRELVIGILCIQGAVVGCFLAADLVVFYLFFEAMLLPVLVLVARHGDADRRGAALQFFLTTMFASAFMLVAIWYLGTAFATTEIAALRGADMSLTSGFAATACFLAFVLAFAVKAPMVPFHSWQARIYAAAPTAVSALLAAVMAKVGIYGFLRFVLPMFPEQTAQWTPVLMTLAVAGTLLGALMALVQRDLKRLMAYASLGHLSLIVVGILVQDQTAFAGVLVQMVAHGLAVAGLFIVIGAMEHRRGARGMDDFGGLAISNPRYAVLLVLSMLAVVAMPGTAAFAGEFMILFGVATAAHGSLILATVVGLSLILTAAYLLRMIKAVAFGPVTQALAPLRAGEGIAAIACIVLGVALGLFPRLITDPAAPLLKDWASVPMIAEGPSEGGKGLEHEGNEDGRSAVVSTVLSVEESVDER